MNQELLLKAYGALYGPEAGPWNLSVEQKYLEYRITAFFEENFSLEKGADVCNIGVGAGYWDRYLSYRLNGGTLTSIDVDPEICRVFQAGLLNEENPNPVTVVNKDVMDCGELAGRFDVVTMVGSTRMESGMFESILRMAAGFLKPGGALYYQSLAQDEDPEDVRALWEKLGLRVKKYWSEAPFGRTYHYWNLTA